MYLLQMENPSEYIRDLIDNDRFAKADPEYLKQKEAELKSELQKIQELKKFKPVQEDKITECIKYWHDVSKNQLFRDKEHLIKYCEKRILPNVKKLGYRGSTKDIAEVLNNWPEED